MAWLQRKLMLNGIPAEVNQAILGNIIDNAQGFSRSKGAPGDGNEGLHRDKSASAYTLLETLIPVLIVATGSILTFLILRKTDRRIYAPRTYLDVFTDEEKTSPPSGGFLGWIFDFYRAPDADLLKKQSLDSYLFLRFLKMMTVITFAGCCITWPVLFPVNASGGGGQSQLDILSFANVADPRRYYVHVMVAWVFLGFVMFTITRETIYFINLRQAYLMTPWNASRISSRTVLFTSVPKRLLSESELRQSFESVRRIWIATDCSELKKLVKDRDDTIGLLESGEIEICKMESSSPSLMSRIFCRTGRPRHKLIPFVGETVDTVNWSQDHLIKLAGKIREQQKAHREGRAAHEPAVFIEFDTMSAAQAAFQMTSQAPLQTVPSCIAVVPSAIVWDNIGIASWQRIVRGMIATGFVLSLIVFWSIPVALIGALSNIGYLADSVSFLRFLKDLPPAVLGAITGLLPSLLLSTLISLVPNICRFVAQQAGEISSHHVELWAQQWHFVFQVVQVFLVTTFTSGAAAVAGKIIDDPKSAPELLAANLPKASNFYMSWFILYGVGQSSKYLLNISDLLSYHVLGWLFDKTPREHYGRYTTLSGIGWASYYPKFTNLAVIAISYSCIAPLMLGFATLGLLALYTAFRYNLLYVYNPTVDTQGQAYSKALQHLTVGVYLSEFCLIGLFAIATRRTDQPAGPLLLMIIFTALTVAYHVVMQRALHPLTMTLPNSLLHQYEQEWQSPHEQEQGHTSTEITGVSTANSVESFKSTPSGVVRLFLKFFEPQKYASYEANLEELLKTHLRHTAPSLPEEKQRDAYLHPAITSQMPKIWIARDKTGISKREIQNAPGDIAITDDGAEIDENGKLKWDKDHLEDLPTWQGRLYY